MIYNVLEVVITNILQIMLFEMLDYLYITSLVRVAIDPVLDIVESSGQVLRNKSYVIPNVPIVLVVRMLVILSLLDRILPETLRKLLNLCS